MILLLLICSRDSVNATEYVPKRNFTEKAMLESDLGRKSEGHILQQHCKNLTEM